MYVCVCVCVCTQAILYNHMLLALWGADTLAVVGSVHEFLLTYKPLSLKQVRWLCPEASLCLKEFHTAIATAHQL